METIAKHCKINWWTVEDRDGELVHVEHVGEFPEDLHDQIVKLLWDRSASAGDVAIHEDNLARAGIGADE